MLWPLQMILSNKQPIYLSGYIEAAKEDYYKALEEGQKKLNFMPFIEFLSETFEASYEEAEKTKSALLSLPDIWLSKTKFRKNSVGQNIVNHLLMAPIVSISELSEKLGVAFPNISAAVDKLVGARVLKERTGYKKNRIFAAEEVIVILARKFGENPNDAIATAQILMAR
jgi:Fic family protein